MASLTSRDFESYGQLGILSENIHRLLSEKECSIFDRGICSKTNCIANGHNYYAYLIACRFGRLSQEEKCENPGRMP